MIEIEQIVPKLGLGDLFTLKRFCLVNNLRYKKIIINTNAIRYYKNTNNPDNYIEFISRFIKKLFQSEIEINNTLDRNLLEDPVSKHNIISKDILLNKHYNFDNSFNNIDHGLNKDNYIIFHTKVRNDDSKNFSNTKKLLTDFFNNFKSELTIVVVGERSISQNIESIVNDFHCIYHELMLMKKNNFVIDLTQHILNDGNINYELFEKDLNYISNANTNIIFGIGGALSLSVSFCEKNIIYMEKETYNGSFKSIISSLENENNLIFTDIEEFLNTLLIKFSKK